MTAIDAMHLLLAKVTETSQAEVARQLGFSTATINRIIRGTYPDAAAILQRVIEVYGGLCVECPYLGEIPLSRCAEERKKPFALVNADYTRQRKACRTCQHNASAMLSTNGGIKP